MFCSTIVLAESHSLAKASPALPRKLAGAESRDPTRFRNVVKANSTEATVEFYFPLMHLDHHAR